jgi:hypothetical protein
MPTRTEASPPANWWPLIAVAFAATALVSGFMGYVVRAPQAEMARSRKAVSDRAATIKEIEKTNASLLNDRRVQRMAFDVDAKGKHLNMTLDDVVSALRLSGVPIKPGNVIDDDEGRRQRFTAGDATLIVFGPEDNIWSVNATGAIPSENLPSVIGLLCGLFAPKLESRPAGAVDHQCRQSRPAA